MFLSVKEASRHLNFHSNGGGRTVPYRFAPMPSRKPLVRRGHISYYGAEPLCIFCGDFEKVTTVCTQCEKPESKCTCEKYCCFCQSQHNVRLCVDGLYYCPDCREACDVQLAEKDDH